MRRLGSTICLGLSLTRFLGWSFSSSEELLNLGVDAAGDGRLVWLLRSFFMRSTGSLLVGREDAGVVECLGVLSLRWPLTAGREWAGERLGAADDGAGFLTVWMVFFVIIGAAFLAFRASRLAGVAFEVIACSPKISSSDVSSARDHKEIMGRIKRENGYAIIIYKISGSK
jgi:hypothetical protein